MPSVPSDAAEPEWISARERTIFLATLSAVDPQLVVDQESAVHYGIATCLDIREGAGRRRARTSGETGALPVRARRRRR